MMEPEKCVAAIIENKRITDIGRIFVVFFMTELLLLNCHYLAHSPHTASRLRPVCLAAYSAWSARASRSSVWRHSPWLSATPMLNVMDTRQSCPHWMGLS